MKEAGVHHRVLEATPLWRSTWRPVQFTLEEARRALPYVARIIADAADAYQQVQAARGELKTPLLPQRRVELNGLRDAALRRLDSAIDECNAVGTDLLDIRSGHVGFNAQIDGQTVGLVWRLGEPVIDAWRSVETALAGTEH